MRRKGIGAGIAKNLAAHGTSVVVNYSSSKEGADKVVAEISKAGGKVIAVDGSVAKSEEIDRLFAETKKVYGKVDILVNNAGVYAFLQLKLSPAKASMPYSASMFLASCS
jgi:3-oxoacyl-[acyl-carrier protein] reductase